MIRWADHLTGICDILGSQVVDGEVRLNLGFYEGTTSDLGIGSDCPVWSQAGLVVRPKAPDADGAAMAFYVQDGDQRRVVAIRDSRATVKLPDLQEGEMAWCGFAGQFLRFHSDGGITLFTTDDGGSVDGRSIYLKISPEDGLIFESPWCRVMAGPRGFHAIHSGGARLDLNAISGLPAPLDTLGSTAKLSAGVVSIEGGAVSIGQPTAPGLANEAAVAALLSVVGAIETVVAAIGVDLAAASAALGVNAGTGAAANTATLLPAIATFTAIAANIGKPA
jgi:hypothetical protein